MKAGPRSPDFAAEVFHADKTYFVLNGSSSANKVVANALLAPGDLVLYDRNNHKSVAIGALIQAGAEPVYLETARNPYGFIGGIDAHCFGEGYLRELAAERNPEKAKAKRPFRLAVIQLDTYDGTLYNARYVVDRIGHLCDYILFDSAWAGYEQFIPMLKDCSPLLLDLQDDDPGILVVQSVHKQQAGFSQVRRSIRRTITSMIRSATATTRYLTIPSWPMLRQVLFIPCLPPLPSMPRSTPVLPAARCGWTA